MDDDTSNPLLEEHELPPFSRIRPHHARPAVEARLAEGRAFLARIEAGAGTMFEDVVAPMEALDERLNRTWSPIGHLHAVADEPAMREAYNECLPLLSDFATETAQHEGLARACRAVRAGPGFEALEPAKRRIVDNALRDFRLAGVDLPARDKERFREIGRRLSGLSARFEENVLDATQAWKKHLTREEDVAGLPASALALAAHNARREGLPGWLLGLDYPSYFPVITYADCEALRREAYRAHTTRASDEGPDAGRWDNTPVMEEILSLRHEQSRLVGFDNYAEYSLARKMAPSTGHVIEFLTDLARRARPAGARELAAIEEYARRRHGRRRVEAWDLAYYAEKLRVERFALSQEDLRPYFPLPRVLDGLFAVAERLYGLRIHRAGESVDTWHPDVALYRIHDAEGALRGSFYLDVYARPHKRGGAWMGECVVRRRRGAEVQHPVAYLVCNFSPPLDDRPALLTHDEVTTLFHEFGHGLHHLLTQVDQPSVAGINGVAWDAVELPSQFMENWCWEREALALLSSHHETGEPLPDPLFERLRAARRFQAGMQTLRQLELALFDFRLHLDHDPGRGARIQDILEAVRREVAVVRPPPFNRFAHAFSHIFGGGYAAGYYSYKWAETLSCDAFSMFEERGIFDRPTGLAFLRTILEQGGTRDAMELFVEFRGREPTIDALLRLSGIADPLPDAETAA